MTTLSGSQRDLTVSIGFFVLVAGAIAASTLARGSTVVGVTFLAVAIGLVVLAIVLHRRPANELRVSAEEIVLRRPQRTIGSLDRVATDGRIEVRRHVYRGRAFWSLVAAGADPTAGIPVDDFVPDEIRAAAEQHGWDVTVIE
jgi:hypothetical protein